MGDMEDRFRCSVIDCDEPAREGVEPILVDGTAQDGSVIHDAPIRFCKYHMHIEIELSDMKILEILSSDMAAELDRMAAELGGRVTRDPHHHR